MPRTALRAAPAFALAALGLLAACNDSPQQVSATPPTASYRVSGSDLGQANESASRHCAQYGMYAQLAGVTRDGSGSVASYSCTGQAVASSNYPAYSSPPPYGAPPAYTPAPGYGAPGYGAAPVQCADWLHQSRPGGTDYKGPPVPGCPPQR